MAAGDYSFNSSFYFNTQMDDEYINDASQFIWDSPQPEPQESNQPAGVHAEDYAATSTEADRNPASGSRAGPSDGHSLPHLTVTHGQTSAQSSASDSSSHSSSSHSSARRKRKASSSSSPPGQQNAAPQAQEDHSTSTFKPEGMFADNDESFAFEDSSFPNMGVGMGNLSLGAMTGSSNAQSFDFADTGASPETLGAGIFPDKVGNYSPQNLGSLRLAQSSHASPQMTVQPSKTFFFGDSREHSPNSAGLINSQESSPAALFNSQSPLTGSADTLTGGFSNSPGFGGMSNFETNALNFSDGMPTSIPQQMSPSTAQRGIGAHWPCRLTVGPTPDKSRVETQIPVKLTLHNPPTGAQKLHLPAHTISKPKFQSKPAFQKADDALELSTMLVCASAMQKDGVQEQAFRRALSDEVPIRNESSTSGGATGQAEDNDPSKPLNGGPVTICQGCIIRERKRAARKKTKKQEEEEEWAKDEAKRVIVFNCSEVRDWCVPGTKESPVKDHEEPLTEVFVNAPMRIACYCRHQSEKLGFQVIFTVKTSQGRVLAQAMSESIMITDDHKQPVSQTSTNTGVAFNTQYPNNGLFGAGEALGMASQLQQDLPFRTSWSTNDLRLLGSQYLPQRNPPSFQRQVSSNVSQASTATATPRNLSRPASPTSPSGHSTKKRRSGGPGHQRIPSGLHMTRVENASPTSIANQRPAGPASAGLTSTGFHFATPSGSTFSSPLEHSFQNAPTSIPSQYQSGPPTPLVGTGLQNQPFSANNVENDPYQYYSAPTSQHPSRPPSPNHASRAGQNTFQSMQVPNQAAAALGSLPPGLNLNRPPIIQRLIPNAGSTSGGDEVTILGSGFFQGLTVMFGDNMASNTTYWGETTLVCRSPPSAHAQSVPVVFKHQHHTAPAALREVQGLIPTRVVPFYYSDDERNQMQSLALGISNQQGGFESAQMGQDDLAGQFLGGQENFGNFSPIGGSSGYLGQQRMLQGNDAAKMDDAAFEQRLMVWLDILDQSDSAQRPELDKRNARGATLLLLASGRGYHRFAAGLLARGANPDSRDRGGYTPIMMASLRDHPRTARLLVLKGGDSTLRNLQGDTAADLAGSAKMMDALDTADLTFATVPLGLAKIPKGSRQILEFRRPSSAASLDSLSGLSSSSQTLGSVGTNNDGDKLAGQQGNTLPAQDNQSSALAAAALAAWRDQILSQLHQFQQSVQCNMPSFGIPRIPAIPHLPALHPKLNIPCYQQYPMVRRISDLFANASGPLLSSQASPPAYEEIYPPSRPRERVVTKKELSAILRSAPEGCVGEKGAALPDGPCTVENSSQATTRKPQVVSVVPAAPREALDTSYSVRSGYMETTRGVSTAFLLVGLLLGLCSQRIGQLMLELVQNLALDASMQVQAMELAV